MHVDRLELTQFRAYERAVVDLPQAGLRIVGRNAAGKTSVLEALVLLSTTRSPRTTSERDVVRWNSGAEYGINPYSRIDAGVTTAGDISQLGISVELDFSGQSVLQRHFLVNGNQVRAMDMVGAIKTVFFSPEDVLLVTGPPSERRRQVDILISQTDRPYLNALSAYSRIWPQRNQLLKRFAREKRQVRDSSAVAEISFWDEELVAAGAMVMATRWSVSQKIASMIDVRSRSLVTEATIGFAYEPRLDIANIVDGRSPDEDLRQEFAGAFHDQLVSVRQDEFRRGMTLIGPHRDDFAFLIDDRSLSSFGSRGQQRLGVVAFRLAEIDILASRSGERPILLLDDVLSELDDVHRNMLIDEIVTCECQLLLTSTDEDVLAHPGLASLPMAEVGNGTIALP